MRDLDDTVKLMGERDASEYLQFTEQMVAKGKTVAYLFLSGPIWFSTDRLVGLAQAQYARLP